MRIEAGSQGPGLVCSYELVGSYERVSKRGSGSVSGARLTVGLGFGLQIYRPMLHDPDGGEATYATRLQIQGVRGGIM